MSWCKRGFDLKNGKPFEWTLKWDQEQPKLVKNGPASWAGNDLLLKLVLGLKPEDVEPRPKFSGRKTGETSQWNGSATESKLRGQAAWRTYLNGRLKQTDQLFKAFYFPASPPDLDQLQPSLTPR